MLRRFNYTGRQRIKREHARFTLFEGNGTSATFSATLQLDEYDLPRTARVYVEAYRRTSWMRFEYGTVESITEPADRTLSRFPDGVAVRFRLKVVGDRSDAGVASVLALADRIRPRLVRARPEQQESLLPVRQVDMPEQPWRVEFEEDQEPVLLISRELVDDMHRLATSDEFVSLVLPEVFRSVLTRILLVERAEDEESVEDWRQAWLRFASGLPGVGQPPRGDPDETMDEREDWIEEAVRVFCRRKNIARRFTHSRPEEG